MPNLSVMKNEGRIYGKRTDENGNTIYHSSKTGIYLCYTKSGSVGVGRTVQEALSYAKDHEDSLHPLDLGKIKN